jgi:hypothetical protein
MSSPAPPISPNRLALGRLGREEKSLDRTRYCRAPGSWPAWRHGSLRHSFSRPLRHFAFQLARASAALVSSFRRVRCGGRLSYPRAAKARKSSRDYPGAMPNDGDMRIDNQPLVRVTAGWEPQRKLRASGRERASIFREKRVQIEQNFAGDLPAFCLLSSVSCILTSAPVWRISPRQ